jgi:hypothetical protein
VSFEKSTILRFAPLSELENPNAHNVPGFNPASRRTLKLRLTFNAKAVPYSRIRIYGYARWNVREINVQSGCEGKERCETKASVYNGLILESQALDADPPGVRLRVLYTEHSPSLMDYIAPSTIPFQVIGRFSALLAASMLSV